MRGGRRKRRGKVSRAGLCDGAEVKAAVFSKRRKGGINGEGRGRRGRGRSTRIGFGDGGEVKEIIFFVRAHVSDLVDRHDIHSCIFWVQFVFLCCFRFHLKLN